MLKALLMFSLTTYFGRFLVRFKKRNTNIMYQNFDFGDLNYRSISLHSNRKAHRKQALRFQKFFALPIWDALTLLPFCKISSLIVDRHLVANEGDRHE
jgi:hypothetical protein